MAAIQAQPQVNGVNMTERVDGGTAALRSAVANVTDRLALEMQHRAGFCIIDE